MNFQSIKILILRMSFVSVIKFIDATYDKKKFLDMPTSKETTAVRLMWMDSSSNSISE